MPKNNLPALHGITVCDFSWVGAGPIATNILAQCGADVIKIESIKRPDILRKGGPFKDGIGTGLDRSGYFANRNPDKKGIALNMGKGKSRDIAEEIIRKSDIIINNFRVGQMEKWELGWDDVKKINPRIIYVTMSLQGTDGPHKDFMGFGVNLNSLCGLTQQAAFEGNTPFGTGTNYTDHVMVPTHTLFAIMAALIKREETGEGQLIRVSQLESAIAMKPADAMAYACNEENIGAIGYGDREMCPHGVYTVLGYRSWVAIAVSGDEQWQTFKEAMGNPAWAETEQFATVEARKANEQELNRNIELWTRDQYSETIVDNLTKRGICAGKVNDAREAVESKHLRDRDFWWYLNHDEVGLTLYNRAPFSLSETPVKLSQAAPRIGQHTEEIMTELLGYDKAEIKQLIDDEVLV